MYMSPPLPATKKTIPPSLPPLQGMTSTPVTVSSKIVSNSEASNHTSTKDKADCALQTSGKTNETFYDSYANVEFSPVCPHRTVVHREDENLEEASQIPGDGDVKADYMNMTYNPKKNGSCNGQHPVKLQNGREIKKSPETGRTRQCETKKKSDAVKDAGQNGGGDYAQMDFKSAEKKTPVKAKGTSPKSETHFEGDFMNVDPSMGYTRLSLSSPQSPSSQSLATKESKVGEGLNSHTLQHSLEELQLKDKSSLGVKSQSLLPLNHQSSSVSSKHIPGTIHPKGSLTPNLNLHHSPVNDPSKAPKYELNYIDVEVDSNSTPHKSDSSSPRSPSSPYRTTLGNDDKEVEPVTYATIDFTKSEGLRNVSAMRESRF